MRSWNTFWGQEILFIYIWKALPFLSLLYNFLKLPNKHAFIMSKEILKRKIETLK